MTPEEVFTEVDTKNREALSKLAGKFSGEEMLALMNASAMYGFRLGSNLALSMLKGALLTKMMQARK